MSWQAASFVTEHSQHKGSYLLTLLMIANHAHADGTGAWPSIATLARETRMSERGVQYCIQKLRDSGELEVIADGGPKGVNGYSIAGMTQSLRDEEKPVTQDSAPVTQNPTPMTQDFDAGDAIAIAPKRSLERIEIKETSAPSALSISHLPYEERIKIVRERADAWNDRAWQRDDAGQRFLISPSTGERVYEDEHIP